MAANRGKKAIIGGAVPGILVFAVALVSAGVLGGCATVSRDSGFGAVEQVARERLNKDVKWPRGDYKDPGWYKHPKGSVAYEWNGALPIS
jgi:hypothetical protein